jgi:Protein of unknown function (DUF3995)
MAAAGSEVMLGMENRAAHGVHEARVLPGGTLPGSTRAGIRWAQAAFMVGLVYALVISSWGLGSTWALDTVGGALGTEGRAGNAALSVTVWASVLLKLIAAILGLAVTRPRHQPQELVVVATWVAAGVLIVYGGVLTFVGLLVQPTSFTPIRMPATGALASHSYLWDPWFLVWGLLLAASLWCSRTQRTPSPPGLTRRYER